MQTEKLCASVVTHSEITFGSESGKSILWRSGFSGNHLGTEAQDCGFRFSPAGFNTQAKGYPRLWKTLRGEMRSGAASHRLRIHGGYETGSDLHGAFVEEFYRSEMSRSELRMLLFLLMRMRLSDPSLQGRLRRLLALIESLLYLVRVDQRLGSDFDQEKEALRTSAAGPYVSRY